MIFERKGEGSLKLCKMVCLTAVALVLSASGLLDAQVTSNVRWVGTWAASPMAVNDGASRHPFCGVTLREIAHVSIGGAQIRVRFTNEFGDDPLTIGDAHVALSAGESSIKDGTDHVLTFGGAATVRIPAGAVMYSDPVSLDVPALSDVAVSFYVPSQNMRSETYHDLAEQTNYVTDGDVAGSAQLSQAKKLDHWYFLDGIDVAAVRGSYAVVTLGDSITDGWQSTPNGNNRWPDVLAARLRANAGTEHVGVLNEGISGNRVLNFEAGPSAMARFDRDVLAQDGVRWMVVLESINDIGRWHDLRNPDDAVTAEQLEQGLRQLVERAHEHGIKVIGAPLTPYGGAGYYSEKGEQIREAVNNWIRTSGTFDAVVDFDKVTRDPQNPTRFNPEDDSGDHLHPGPAGYKAMGSAIDLKLFESGKTASE